ncbi:hypothetical protein B0H15DRAFT_803973 [Mycena belliarum]|uniref:Uncharacterized protein n=1 Tax=Mycena belliarum TaxID=1033014 RepID=A0AAD6XM08_9AGAR|nr:hypothetical protein B0H15DRAFT_803973 [Mycena belliae]
MHHWTTCYSARRPRTLCSSSFLAVDFDPRRCLGIIGITTSAIFGTSRKPSLQATSDAITEAWPHSFCRARFDFTTNEHWLVREPAGCVHDATGSRIEFEAFPASFELVPKRLLLCFYAERRIQLNFKRPSSLILIEIATTSVEVPIADLPGPKRPLLCSYNVRHCALTYGRDYARAHSCETPKLWQFGARLSMLSIEPFKIQHTLFPAAKPPASSLRLLRIEISETGRWLQCKRGAPPAPLTTPSTTHEGRQSGRRSTVQARAGLESEKSALDA